jgi:hypothetical protein
MSETDYEGFWERVEERENDLSWLRETAPDGSPLDELQVRIPLEAGWITELRALDGGPYYVTADSGEQIPPNFYAGIDPKAIAEAAKAAKAAPPENVTPDGKTVLPPEQESHLKNSGPAGRKLLERLERGLEASTPKLREAMQERRRKEGLL